MGIFDNLFKKKRLQEEMTIGGKTINVNSDAMTFSQKGLEKYETRDFEGAISEFTKAINSQPTNQNFYTMRGTAFEDSGDTDLAQNDFLKALSIDPRNYLAHFRLGMLYFNKKQYDVAIKNLRKAFDYCPDADINKLGLSNGSILFVDKKVIAANLGNFLTMVNEINEGIKFLNISIKLDPNYSNPYLIKGLTIARSGQHEEALICLEKALSLGHPNAEKAISIVRKNLNKFDITYKKQTFNNEELALLFKAFSKKLFIRPTSGDISSEALNFGLDGCYFYFKSNYYEELKSDIERAFTQGEFSRSNASLEWQALMKTFLDAEDIIDFNTENLKDYYSDCSPYWS